MANTYTSLHYHIVSSTKNREAWVSQLIEDRVWEYLGGIARNNDIIPIKIGGIDDHVHLVVSIPPTLSISKAVQLVKGGSSLWFHQTFRRSAFAWQDGYGAFTVSKSQLPDVVRYVERQREHHRLQNLPRRVPGSARQAWHRLRRAVAVGMSQCVANATR
jgi:putative transposase